MGEARSKSRKRQEILASCPFCIFCGGEEVATTIDHVPPRGMFLRRDRPSGLEFGACEACNTGSRNLDLIAGMLSRIMITPASELELAEFEKQAGEVAKRFPDLYRELNPSFRQLKLARRNLKDPDAGALNCRGERLNRVMKSFAAKIGVALHHEATKSILPNDGLVIPLWVSNTALFDNSFPRALSEMLGETLFLKQGMKTSKGQFAFQSRRTIDGETTAHIAYFREAFATVTTVFPNADEFHEMKNRHKPIAISPGWLRTFSI